LSHRRAKADLQWIYDTIESATDPSTALHYVERITDFCQRLEYGGERGNRRDDVRPGLRVIGFERRIAVAFTVDAERVVILRLFYGGADWEGTFED
jgi:toxin ParE1/3/4